MEQISLESLGWHHMLFFGMAYARNEYLYVMKKQAMFDEKAKKG